MSPKQKEQSKEAKSDTLNREDREQQILMAALEVFSHKGFDGSRTKDIAKQAGISEALVFKYFSTKKNILLAIAKPLQKLMMPIFMDGLVKKIQDLQNEPSEAILEEVIRDRMQLLGKHQNLLLTLITEASRNPELLAMVREIILPKVEEIVLLALEPAIRRGELRITDTATLSRSFLSLVAGSVLLSRIQPAIFGAPDEQGLPHTIATLFLDGVRKPKEAQGEGI